MLAESRLVRQEGRVISRIQEAGLANSPSQQDGRTQLGQRRRAETRAKIIASAFAIFGEENGLFARIEDVADKAGVTRATFYNHFNGMVDFREAVTHEVTHDFLVAVTGALQTLPDPRERCTAAVRLYLHRARTDHRWAWSMMNVSASGLIFGAETYRQAEQTIREGIESGALPIPSMELGRDILMGATLAAMGSMLKDEVPQDYPEAVAGYILCGLGVDHAEARAIAHLPLPELRAPA